MNITAAVTTVLALIESIAPSATAATIQKIIALLLQFMPLIINEIMVLKQPVSNIIAMLRGNGEVTPEQLDALDAMEAKIDVDYDAALAKAKAEDSNSQ